jgi:hypothetical protein
MAKNLQFTGEKAKTAAEQIMKLYNMFIAVDATQVNNTVLKNGHYNHILGRNQPLRRNSPR